MKIGNQSAGQITNIETLNGNFNLSNEIFSLSHELTESENEILLCLKDIKSSLIEKGSSTEELSLCEENIKKNILIKNEKGIISSIKKYIGVFKKTIKNTNEAGIEINKLLKLGSSIGKFLFLISMQ